MTVHGAEPGVYIQFESPPGVEMKLETLEDRRQGIELVAVQRIAAGPEEPVVQLATVFVPDGSLKHFFNRFEQYERERTRKDEPRHKDMIDFIEAQSRSARMAEPARYASHGLRFELNSPTENVDDFRKRLNRRALDEDEEKPAAGGDAAAWYLGEAPPPPPSKCDRRPQSAQVHLRDMHSPHRNHSGL